MRKAFADTMNDPEFVAFATSRNFPVSPVSWQALHNEIEKVKAIIRSNPGVVDIVREVMGIK